MTVWDERAEAYRRSREHSEGWDLDVLVLWAAGSKTALDVATGGGHVARRLRAEGLHVVSSDPSPGMQPDVVAPAEDLPSRMRASISWRADLQRTTSRTSRRESAT